MFQSLRANNQLYILHKESKPYLETGVVSGVSAPRPKYPASLPIGQLPQMEMVVDVSVNINGQHTSFQGLPAGADIADFGQSGNIVISTSRDAMNNEVSAMRKRSEEIIASADFHKEVMSSCDGILSALNPEFAEKQRQEKEILALKEQMGTMSKDMSDLMALNRKLLERLGMAGSGSSSKNNKGEQNHGNVENT